MVYAEVSIGEQMLSLSDERGWCLVMSFGLLVCIASDEPLADLGRRQEDTPRAPGKETHSGPLPGTAGLHGTSSLLHGHCCDCVPPINGPTPSSSVFSPMALSHDHHHHQGALSAARTGESQT